MLSSQLHPLLRSALRPAVVSVLAVPMAGAPFMDTRTKKVSSKEEIQEELVELVVMNLLAVTILLRFCVGPLFTCWLRSVALH